MFDKATKLGVVALLVYLVSLVGLLYFSFVSIFSHHTQFNGLSCVFVMFSLIFFVVFARQLPRFCVERRLRKSLHLGKSEYNELANFGERVLNTSLCTLIAYPDVMDMHKYIKTHCYCVYLSLLGLKEGKVTKKHILGFTTLIYQERNNAPIRNIKLPLILSIVSWAVTFVCTIVVSSCVGFNLLVFLLLLGIPCSSTTMLFTLARISCLTKWESCLDKSTCSPSMSICKEFAKHNTGYLTLCKEAGVVKEGA